jgi:hypothetical protein
MPRSDLCRLLTRTRILGRIASLIDHTRGTKGASECQEAHISPAGLLLEAARVLVVFASASPAVKQRTAHPVVLRSILGCLSELGARAC